MSLLRRRKTHFAASLARGQGPKPLAQTEGCALTEVREYSASVMPATWRPTVFLLIAYLMAFHFWMVLGAGWRIASTVLAAIALTTILIRGARQGHFLNRWDLVFHAAVVLDIFVEGLFISAHEDFGFYFCALGFATVIIGYRAVLLRKQGASASRLAV